MTPDPAIAAVHLEVLVLASLSCVVVGTLLARVRRLERDAHFADAVLTGHLIAHEREDTSP